jgi:ADP-ribose pyrophosphatase YjhB (NUDIX family)
MYNCVNTTQLRSVNQPKSGKYTRVDRILVALDCIVFGWDGEALKLLIIERDFEPEKGKWSLMGGFLKKDESLIEAANRILYNLTGLEKVYFEELSTYGSIHRDPVERTISICYFALINIKEINQEAVRAHNAHWVELNHIPRLIFDHNDMVKHAHEKLKYKAAVHPIGFELLPSQFTLPQLQKLYEAIYATTIDRRNFSRKILATKLLIDTGKKNHSSTTKRAILYKLDAKKYIKQLHTFHNFFQ